MVYTIQGGNTFTTFHFSPCSKIYFFVYDLKKKTYEIVYFCVNYSFCLYFSTVRIVYSYFSFIKPVSASITTKYKLDIVI